MLRWQLLKHSICDVVWVWCFFFSDMVISFCIMCWHLWFFLRHYFMSGLLHSPSFVASVKFFSIFFHIQRFFHIICNVWKKPKCRRKWKNIDIFMKHISNVKKEWFFLVFGGSIFQESQPQFKIIWQWKLWHAHAIWLTILIILHKNMLKTTIGLIPIWKWLLIKSIKVFSNSTAPQ